jgi:hypothetical protein
MSANFPKGLHVFQSEADKCFGVCMLINPWVGYTYIYETTWGELYDIHKRTLDHVVRPEGKTAALVLSL